MRAPNQTRLAIKAEGVACGLVFEGTPAGLKSEQTVRKEWLEV